MLDPIAQVWIIDCSGLDQSLLNIYLLFEQSQVTV